MKTIERRLENLESRVTKLEKEAAAATTAEKHPLGDSEKLLQVNQEKCSNPGTLKASFWY